MLAALQVHRTPDGLTDAIEQELENRQEHSPNVELVGVSNEGLLVELRGLEPLTFSLRRCPLVKMKSMPRVNRLMNRQWTTRDEARGCMRGARLARRKALRGIRTMLRRRPEWPQQAQRDSCPLGHQWSSQQGRLTGTQPPPAPRQEPPLCRSSNHHVPLPLRVEGALHYPESDALQFRHEFLVPVRPEGQPLRTRKDSFVGLDLCHGDL